MLFIVKFLEVVRLRSAELLNARLENFEMEPEVWLVQVHGKGSKNRPAVVPAAAMQALQEYLGARGLRGIERAGPLTATGFAPLPEAANAPRPSAAIQPLVFQFSSRHLRSQDTAFAGMINANN